MNPFILFLQEVFKRLSSKSPKFFQIWQWITGGVSAITGIPAILEAVGIKLTGLPFELESKAVAICSALMYIIAKLPVENPTITVTSDGSVLKKTDSEKLPFTNDQETKAAEDKGLTGTATLNDVINSTNK